MDYTAELTAIAKEHGGIIQTNVAAKHGISKTVLCNLNKKNQILRIMNGQYILPEDVPDELFSLSKRSYDVCLYVTLESPEALDAYQLDPYHCNVVKTYVAGVRETAVAVDYIV